MKYARHRSSWGNLGVPVASKEVESPTTLLALHQLLDHSGGLLAQTTHSIPIEIGLQLRTVMVQLPGATLAWPK